jgi:hypothetical protein
MQTVARSEKKFVHRCTQDVFRNLLLSKGDQW